MKKWVIANPTDVWLKDTLHLLFYLMEDGKIKQIDLSTKLLDHYLTQGYQILACIDETWIWGKRKIAGVVEYDSVKGRAHGHYIVIYDQDKNDYLISDPYPTAIPGKEGLYQIDKDKILVSILTWAKQVLVFKPINFNEVENRYT
jgi:hypothetical protein